MLGTGGDGLGSVVVATDFSDRSRAALERVALLPLGVGAAVEILHATPDEPERVGHAGAEAAVRTLLEADRRTLTRALATKDRKRDVFISAKRGHPFREIARTAHHGRAELIVLGRHEHGTLRQRLFGATAERVVRLGDVSVLVVRRPPDGPYRRPLVAVDLSSSSRLAIELALRLSEGTAASVAIVHVLPLLDTVDLPVPTYRLAHDEQLARREVARFLRDIDPGQATFDVVIQAGDPRSMLLEEARARKADLIALGTQGRRGVARAVLGSVSERVLRAATCDVLVARLPRARIDL